ncbi:MAG: hypothetical protein ABSB15_24070 [Bryobacteraceae bacterium]
MPQPLSPAPALLQCRSKSSARGEASSGSKGPFCGPSARNSALAASAAPLSRIIWPPGRQQNSGSDEYFLHSRAVWSPQAQYHRDPLSPPFHVNLIGALRFPQASVLLPLHRSALWSARGIPIRFEEVSSVKKPGRRAGEEAWKIQKREVRERNFSRRFVQSMAELRQTFDRAGAQKKVLVIVGDGSFRNRTVLSGIPDRAVPIARTRKDASLRFRAPEGENSRTRLSPRLSA